MKTPTLLGPLGRANLNHWSTKVNGVTSKKTVTLTACRENLNLTFLLYLFSSYEVSEVISEIWRFSRWEFPSELAYMLQCHQEK
jgi:hypothetical protein